VVGISSFQNFIRHFGYFCGNFIGLRKVSMDSSEDFLAFLDEKIQLYENAEKFHLISYTSIY